MGRGPKPLLLYDGAAETDEGYENLGAIAHEVRDCYPEQVDVLVVVPRPERPKTLDWDGALVFDPELELHDHFGARSESLYLIRPDGYVGFRAQPAAFEPLLGFLGRLLT